MIPYDKTLRWMYVCTVYSIGTCTTTRCTQDLPREGNCFLQNMPLCRLGFKIHCMYVFIYFFYEK